MSNNTSLSNPSSRVLNAPASADGNGHLSSAMQGDKPAEINRRSSGWGWAVAIGRTVLSLLIVAAGIGVFVGLGKGHAPATRTSTSDAVPLVEAVAVAPHDTGIEFDVSGVVVPFQEVQVPAEVAGRVAFRSDNCRIGHVVRQGELLLRIDTQDYALEVRRLEEQLKQAEADLNELDVEAAAGKRQIELAKEDLVIKQREVRRYEQIDEPGVYSKSELDAARLKELQSRDALQTEVDQLEILQARRGSLLGARDLVARQLEKAKLDLTRTEIRSPLSGVITQEPVEQGNYVQRGGVVAVVQDTSCMEVCCSLQMKEMHWLWQSPAGTSEEFLTERAYRFPKTPVTVVYPMEGAKCTWQGELQHYDGGKIDEQTRMVPCRVRVCEPTRVAVETTAAFHTAPPVLMSGMFVTVRVHAKPAIPLIRVPEAAVQPGGTVWTVKDGRLHELPLRVAHATSREAIAYRDDVGPQPGDVVVVSPLAAPTEDAPVAQREGR